MEVKFTPGPWRSFPCHSVQYSPGRVKVDYESPVRDYGITATFPYDGPSADISHVTVSIAHVYITTSREHEAKFNANLIAAAPDLYAALEDALEQLKAYEMELSGEAYNSPTINAALAKARGER